MTQILKEVDAALPHPALPHADWADAYRITVDTPFANARAAGKAAFSTFPLWVNALMGLRNLIVSPFGLKKEADRRPSKERIGFFPIIAESERELVVGMNDRHLDFRCVIEIANHDFGQNVTIATVIQRHNWLGRVYLALVTPFHRVIVRSALARLANAD